MRREAVTDTEPNLEGPNAHREVAKVRRHLLVYFGLGCVGLAIAVAWAARSLPEGGLPDPYGAETSTSKGRDEGRATSPQRCARFGDRCEYSPGKLGTCIQREGCTGAGCLFCQSQH